MNWLCCNQHSVEDVESPTETVSKTTSNDPATHNSSTSIDNTPVIPSDDADILDPRMLKKMNKQELSSKVTQLAGDKKKAKEAIVKNQEEISFLTKARDNDHEEMTKLLYEKDEEIENLMKELELLKKRNVVTSASSIEDQDRELTKKQSVIVSDDENSNSEEHNSVKLLLANHSVEAISLSDEANNNDSSNKEDIINIEEVTNKSSESSNDIPKEIFKKHPDISSPGKTNDYKASDSKEFNLAEETLDESGSEIKLSSLPSLDALITTSETKEKFDMDYAVHGDNQAIVPTYDDTINTELQKLKNDYEKVSYALTQTRHKNDKLSSQITKLELHHTRDSLKKEIVLQSTLRESKCKIKSLSQRITELERLYDEARKEVSMKDERILTFAERSDSRKDGTSSAKVEWETALKKALAGNEVCVRKMETLEGDIEMAKEDVKRKEKRIGDLERELGDLHRQLTLATTTTAIVEMVGKENRAHSPIREDDVEVLTLVQKPEGENDDDGDKDRQQHDTMTLEAENKVLSSKVNELEHANKELNDELEKKRSELDSLMTEVDKKTVTQVQKPQGENDDDNDKERKQHDKVTLEAENKALSSKVNELELTNKETNDELEKKCVELDSLRNDMVTFETENKVLSSKVNELEHANKELNDELEKKRKELDSLMTEVDKKTVTQVQKPQRENDDDDDKERKQHDKVTLETENKDTSSKVNELERANKETNDEQEKTHLMTDVDKKTKSVLQKLQKKNDDVDDRQKTNTAKLEEENKVLSSMVNDLERVNRETNDKLEKNQAELNSIMAELEKVRSSLTMTPELNVKNESEEIHERTATVEMIAKTTTTTTSKDHPPPTLPFSLEALQTRNSQLKLINIALKVTLKKERTAKTLFILDSIKTIETERRRKEILMKTMEERIDDLNRQLNDSRDVLKGCKETMAAKEEELKGMMDEVKRREEMIGELEKEWRKKEGEMGQASRKYSTTSRRDFSLICSLRKDLQDARSQSLLLQQQLDETNDELSNVTRERNVTKTKIKFLNSGKKLKVDRRGGDARLSENICVCIRVRPIQDGDLQQQQQQQQQQSTRWMLSPSNSKRSLMSPGSSSSSGGVGLPPSFSQKSSRSIVSDSKLTSSRHSQHSDEREQNPFRFLGMDVTSTTADDNSVFSGSGASSSSSPSYNIALVEPFKDRGGLSPIRKTYKFEFDHIFPPNSTQDDIWHTVADSFIDNVITGENVCVLSYGMSGSGKSYTLFGEPNNAEDGGDEGIVYRSAKTLFLVKDNLEKEEEGIEVDIFVEFVEIYNEKVNDLLVETTTSSTTMSPSSDTDTTTIFHGNSSSVVSIVSDSSNTTTAGSSGHGGPRCARCLEDVMKLLSMTTTPQKKSSCRKKRHLVLTFHFIVNDLKKSSGKEGSRGYKGQLRFFDLASGERVGDNMDENTRKETHYINQSLSALTTLIEKLKSSPSSKDANATTHIPYRDSKLTQMLYESLRGDSKTLAIICCSPLSSHMNESLSSLRFAAKLMSKKGNDDDGGGGDGDGSDSRYGDLRSPSVKKILLY